MLNPMLNPRVDTLDYVRLDPDDFVERTSADWPGLQADVVTARERKPFDYRLRSKYHLLIAAEHSERDDGETSVEGLPTSTLRSLSGKLTFIPAGHDCFGWQDPRVLMRISYFYVDPQALPLDEELRFSEIEFKPRLFFFDAELWRLTEKLKQETNNGGRLPHYGQALSVLLGHELIRIGTDAIAPAGGKGGLSGWQEKRVACFIEEHLAEELTLSALADLVGLSPYHFARAFKRSFGVPPHRYHTGRRIERAKVLLAERSVTDVALAVGFAETSSFSAAFRRATGASPREFRRTARA